MEDDSLPTDDINDADVTEANGGDSNIVSMTGEPVADVANPPATPKEARNKWVLEAGSAVCTYPNGSKEAFPMGSLPEAVRQHITFLGLTILLARYEDMGAAFDRLVAGEVPARKAKAVKVDTWRLAIAQALVEVMKKAGRPISIDDAKARAASMSASAVAMRKTDVNVVREYNKITKKTSTLQELVADLAA